MPKLFYVHWNRAELDARASALEAAGYHVIAHGTAGEWPHLGDFVPDAVVISLERLPSHGRGVAEWFWEAKKRRAIPILFVGGAVDKVEAARTQFSDAIFCASEDVMERLAELIAAPVAREAARPVAATSCPANNPASDEGER